jgi:hypothetical protein
MAEGGLIRTQDTEYRTQNTEHRTQNTESWLLARDYALVISMEQLARFIQKFKGSPCFSIIQVSCKNQKVPALFGRSQGDIKEPGLVRIRSPFKSFSDVSWN